MTAIHLPPISKTTGFHEIYAVKKALKRAKANNRFSQRKAPTVRSKQETAGSDSSAGSEQNLDELGREITELEITLESKRKEIRKKKEFLYQRKELLFRQRLKFLREKSAVNEQKLTKRAELAELRGRTAFLEKELSFTQAENVRREHHNRFIEDFFRTENIPLPSDNSESVEVFVAHFKHKAAQMRLRNLNSARKEMKSLIQKPESANKQEIIEGRQEHKLLLWRINREKQRIAQLQEMLK